MKKCNGCNQEKLANEFHKGNGSLGLKSRCKICCKLSYKVNSKEYKKQYYETNLIASRLSRAEYNHRNIDARNKYSKEYDRRHRAAKTARENARRAKKLNATPKWLTKVQLGQIKGIYGVSNLISKLFDYKLHVDHITPLQGRIVSGLHVPWNLQILLGEDNVRKGNRFLNDLG